MASGSDRTRCRPKPTGRPPPMPLNWSSTSPSRSRGDRGDGNRRQREIQPRYGLGHACCVAAGLSHVGENLKGLPFPVFIDGDEDLLHILRHLRDTLAAAAFGHPAHQRLGVEAPLMSHLLEEGVHLWHHVLVQDVPPSVGQAKQRLYATGACGDDAGRARGGDSRGGGVADAVLLDLLYKPLSAQLRPRKPPVWVPLGPQGVGNGEFALLVDRTQRGGSRTRPCWKRGTIDVVLRQPRWLLLCAVGVRAQSSGVCREARRGQRDCRWGALPPGRRWRECRGR